MAAESPCEFPQIRFVGANGEGSANSFTGPAIQAGFGYKAGAQSQNAAGSNAGHLLSDTGPIVTAVVLGN